MISLHTHSEYSWLDGFGTPDRFAKRAKELNQNALAITEHGNVCSALVHKKACKKHGIKPIYGCEFYMVPDVDVRKAKEKRGHIVILAKNLKGWESICRMSSYANVKGFYYKPRIDYDILLEQDLENLIITTACAGSFVYLEDGWDFVSELIDNKADIFCEIQPQPIQIHLDHNAHIFELAKEFNLDLVAGIDAHYPRKEDAHLQEALLAIQTKAKLSDPDRFAFVSDDYYMMTDDQFRKTHNKQCALGMSKAIEKDEITDAINNTHWIADECNVEIGNKKICLPLPIKFKPEQSKYFAENTEEDVLWDLCVIGFQKRFGIDINLAETEGGEGIKYAHGWYFANEEDKIKKYEIYLDRLNEEFDLIEDKGFCRYFLIVYDVLNWCRENDIPVGPGRGSAAGSLMAYLLDITQLDPVEEGLIFSRFLNAERNDYPDMDLDISKERRIEVIDYLRDQYGNDKTAYILTVQQMKAKAVIRDVGRICELPSKEVDQFAKSVWDGNDNPLEDAFDDAHGLIFQKKYKYPTELINGLHKTVRGTGKHAAGFIISDKSLMSGEQCALMRNKDDKNTHLISWTMDDCEDQGLIKLDVLGLATLDVLWHSCKLTGVKLPEIPMEDKLVFDLIKQGRTLGMFQLETKASTYLVKDLRPNNFKELVAMIALVRPGPMDSGMTELYIKRKNGEKWRGDYHEIYENITNDTQGVLIYQEQIMQCISLLGALPYTVSDKIRKVIGKKRDTAEFVPYWEMFRDGCNKAGTFSEKEAEEFWAGLLKWASYGFNKSHSSCYALLSYYTAWFKVNHYKEFLCASLSYGTWDETKKNKNNDRFYTLEEAVKLHKLNIFTPKDGISDGRVWTFKDNDIYMPYSCIKGVGEVSSLKISKERNRTGGTPSFFDDNDFAHSTAENKEDEILAKMLTSVKNRIPDKKVLDELLPFRLPVSSKRKLNIKTKTDPIKLPDFSDMNNIYYTGVGSRKTPGSIINLINEISFVLTKKGFWLRSGGANGADQAFENNSELSDIYFAEDSSIESEEIAAKFHPNWNNLSPFVKKLHGRNSFQVLGSKLNEPSYFLICWTEDGCTRNSERNQDTGGTGTAISIADFYKVPTYNLGKKTHFDLWERFVNKELSKNHYRK